MKIFLQNLKDTPRTLIRRAGYGEHYDARSQQISYSRRLGTGVFPKYHVYLEEKNGGVEVSLHLDQKQASYGVGHMHSGDYEGENIERELERIRQSFEKPASGETDEDDDNDNDDEPKGKGFFGKIFG